MLDIIVDARCWQHADTADRPGAAIALALVTHARACTAVPQGARLIAIADPRMPDLPHRYRALFDGVRHTAYTGALDRPAWLITPEPFAHDPLFTARLLHHPAVLGAAILADLPSRSAAPAARVERALALYWLSCHSIFLADSERAASQLRADLPAAGAAIAIVGNPTRPADPAEDIARRAWSAIAARHAPRPAPMHAPLIGGAKPRIALLSPLPPAPGGCSVYSAATSAALARHVELQLFTPTPTPARPPGLAPPRPLSALPLLAPSFDRVIGVMGNSDQHAGIFDLLLRYGGAVIGHDARMLGFYRYLFGDTGAARQASRELGREVTQDEVLTWAHDESQLDTLYYGEIADIAEPLIVHAPSSAELIRQHYGVPVTYLPFAAQHPWTDAQLDAAPRAAARARLGIAPGEIAIATFGFIAHDKSPGRLIDALAALHTRGVPATLRFVGATLIPLDTLRTQAAALGVGDHVRFLDTYVTDAAFRAHLLAADLGIQLRSHDFGSISGALMDCATAGLPTVAGRSLATALGTPSYVHAVTDPADPEQIADAWMALLAEGGRNNPRWRDERRAFSEERSFDVYAAQLCAALGIESAAA